MTSYCVDCKHSSIVNLDLHCALCLSGVTGLPRLCAEARDALNRSHYMIPCDGSYQEPKCREFEGRDE